MPWTATMRLAGSKGPYPYHEGEHLIVAVTLEAYGDESGIQAGAPYCVVHGYIGSPRQWSAFSKEWLAVLEPEGLSSFHAKEFFARRREPYRAWSTEKAVRFLDGLAGTIHRHRLTPIGGAVDVAAFDALTYGERRFLTGGGFRPGNNRFITSGAPSKPYYLAFQQLVVAATNEAKNGILVNFTFDRQNVLQSRAVDTFQQLTRTLEETRREKLGRISFDVSDRNPELQAADLITHSWYSHLSRRKNMGSLRRHAMNLLTRKRNSILLLDTVLLEEMLSGLKPSEREAMRKQSEPS